MSNPFPDAPPKKGGPNISLGTIRRIRELAAQGKGVCEIAEMVGGSRATTLAQAVGSAIYPTTQTGHTLWLSAGPTVRRSKRVAVMGSLTPFLQREIPNRLPTGWSCGAEVPLLSAEMVGLLGYDPRADVVLTHAATGTRVWVEFEVSRADPVANHAKFATAHLFAPQGPADHFVAMLSSHIDRGRRNLAAATVRLMRRVGMSAFQTTLLPLTAPTEVRRLNQLPADALAKEVVDVTAEVERALATVIPVGRWGRLDVHFAGDLLDAVTNLHGWNDDLRTDAGRQAWGQRACTYFVHDPTSGAFAPSKFCAYTPVHPTGGHEGSHWHRMSAVAYAALNDGTHVMDGSRARRHLARNLGMREVAASDAGPISARFAAWLVEFQDVLTVRGGQPAFLLPPMWYAGR